MFSILGMCSDDKLTSWSYQLIIAVFPDYMTRKFFMGKILNKETCLFSHISSVNVEMIVQTYSPERLGGNILNEYGPCKSGSTI